MKTFKSTLIFLCTVALPISILFIFLDESLFMSITSIYLLIWGGVYLFLDKFILMSLEAREIIETEQHGLFQAIKNQRYKNFQTMPRVYLYTGHMKNCLILEARNEWSIVIDRKLMDILEAEQVEDFVEMLFKIKMSNVPWLQTKLLGIIIFLKTCVYLTFHQLKKFQKLKYIYYSFVVFFISLLKPIIAPLEAWSRRGFQVSLPENMKPLLNQIELSETSYSNHLLDHLIGHMTTRDWIVSYIENYSPLRNHKFECKIV